MSKMSGKILGLGNEWEKTRKRQGNDWKKTGKRLGKD